MKERPTNSPFLNKNVRFTLITTVLILSIPLIAMQFSEEWDWGVFDFIIIGTLLIGAGLLYDWTSRRVNTTRERVLIGLGLLLAVLVTWAQLAVGIFGRPFGGD